MNDITDTGIECHETNAEACTTALVGKVFNNLRDHYLDITPEMVEHAVSETLYAISFALRGGEVMSVEAIGDFIPCLIGEERLIRFHPAPGLFLPLPAGSLPLIHLSDRRQPQESNA